MTTRPRPKATKADEPVPKDVWDKVDIIVRALIPVIVALSVYLWNVERTSRDTAAQMITIATSILTAPPEQATPNALRLWAIAVLQSPDDPPTLTDEAAVALRTQSIPFYFGLGGKLLSEKDNLKLEGFPVSPFEPRVTPVPDP
jgi:hypothetical protein